MPTVKPVAAQNSGAGSFFALLVAQLKHLDLTALRGDGQTLRADRRHRADRAAHLRETLEQVLARVQQLQTACRRTSSTPPGQDYSRG